MLKLPGSGKKVPTFVTAADDVYLTSFQSLSERLAFVISSRGACSVSVMSLCLTQEPENYFFSFPTSFPTLYASTRELSFFTAVPLVTLQYRAHLHGLERFEYEPRPAEDLSQPAPSPH